MRVERLEGVRPRKSAVVGFSKSARRLSIVKRRSPLDTLVFAPAVEEYKDATSDKTETPRRSADYIQCSIPSRMDYATETLGRTVAENEVLQVFSIWRDVWAHRPRSRAYGD
jgi:hypothetical protein